MKEFVIVRFKIADSDNWHVVIMSKEEMLEKYPNAKFLKKSEVAPHLDEYES